MSMHITERLQAVRRTLRQAGVDYADILPFAVSERDMYDLKNDPNFFRENINERSDGIYTYRGLKIMKGYGGVTE